MCSGERSSSAKGAMSARQAAPSGWSTSSSRVRSDWMIRGPAVGSPAGVAHASASSSASVRTRAHSIRLSASTRLSHVRELEDHVAVADVEDGRR